MENYNITKPCGTCGKPVTRPRSKLKLQTSGLVFCSKDCRYKKGWAGIKKGTSLIGERTLEYYSKKYKGANKWAAIRDNANVIAASMQQTCSNCSYDKHVEVCHIKAISSFPLSAKIAEVNSPKNLILLCPNCHWEFDNGLLKVQRVGVEPTTVS